MFTAYALDVFMLFFFFSFCSVLQFLLVPRRHFACLALVDVGFGKGSRKSTPPGAGRLLVGRRAPCHCQRAAAHPKGVWGRPKFFCLTCSSPYISKQLKYSSGKRGQSDRAVCRNKYAVSLMAGVWLGWGGRLGCQPEACGADAHCREKRAAEGAGARWHHGKKGHGLCKHKDRKLVVPKRGLSPPPISHPPGPGLVPRPVLPLLCCSSTPHIKKGVVEGASATEFRHWQHLQDFIHQCPVSYAFPCALVKWANTDP